MTLEISPANVQLVTALTRLLNGMQTDNDNTITLINELRTDHATTKTSLDAARTAIIELIDDHATFKTVVDDLKTLVNNLRLDALQGVYNNPVWAISTNFDVQNTNAFTYKLGGVLYSEAATQAFDTGTSQVIAIDRWSSGLLSLNAAGAETVTWSATLDAANEAAAIAALPATPADHVAVGYFTVLTGSGVTWTAGTDALAGGTGGTPAATTNYYNIPGNGTVTAAVASSSPATLTATDPAAGPATITAAAVTATVTKGR